MTDLESKVAHWLASIPGLADDNADADNAESFQDSARQRKRRKLDKKYHCIQSQKIPSPPATEGRRHPSLAPSAASTSSSAPNEMSGPDPSRSRKRPLPNDDAVLQPGNDDHETTPRPARFQPQESAGAVVSWRRGSSSNGNSNSNPDRGQDAAVSWSSASTHSRVSNRSSPSKQLRNAEMLETGFSVGTFTQQAHPESLRSLRLQLRDIGSGNSILPASWESELQALGAEIPRFAFDRDELTRDATEAAATCLPRLGWVQRVVQRAAECDTDRECEASWNTDVHAAILEQAIRYDRFASARDSLVDFRYCPPAQIHPAYRPLGAPSKMIDYCLFVRPPRGSPEEAAIKSLCSTRPGLSINHTDLGNLCKHPIALSIETKRPGEQADSAARLQMGTWHSAQWRSLGFIVGRDRAPAALEFLPGLIIQGHSWQFVASILDEDGRSMLLETVTLGRTDSNIGVYSLCVALRRLREWIETEYWPAFTKDVLGL